MVCLGRLIPPNTRLSAWALWLVSWSSTNTTPREATLPCWLSRRTSGEDESVKPLTVKSILWSFCLNLDVSYNYFVRLYVLVTASLSVQLWLGQALCLSKRQLHLPCFLKFEILQIFSRKGPVTLILQELWSRMLSIFWNKFLWCY